MFTPVDFTQITLHELDQMIICICDLESQPKVSAYISIITLCDLKVKS